MSMRITFLAAVFAILALIAVGCEEQNEHVEISQEEKDEIVAVIEKNIEATEEENIEAFSETMYQDHPEFDIAVEETKQLFEQFDLEYELEIQNVSLVDEEIATVEFEQETRAINGRDFDDNVATGVHEVRKENGQWKIYETEITESRPIE